MEYGFRTLSYLLFVAVSVDLRVLQRVSASDASKLKTKNNRGVVNQREVAERSTNTLHMKSTTQYMQEEEAVQLSARALLKLTDPDGTITTTVRAVTSILLAIGNLCHNNLEGKLFIVSHTHNVKRFHLTGKFKLQLLWRHLMYAFLLVCEYSLTICAMLSYSPYYYHRRL